MNMASATVLVENKVFVEEKRKRDQLIQRGFGELTERKLVLDLFESLFLMEKDKLEIQRLTGKDVDEKSLLKLGLKLDKQFYSKFLVFRDLRSKGFVVRTGLKFGFDFRVYPKGKKPGEEHTYWVIHVSTQDEKVSFPEISRMVRLAGNIHTIVLQAVVDSEDDINYYELRRITP
ncbi:MAG: tRNA-intron lyase [Candidatus Diapherotrites archaeon]|nr:tRNA-intron lyase [Candidatus Diapherotrites archaeon]